MDHSVASVEAWLRLYLDMCRIRTFEDRANDLFQEGLILGTAHSCAGQEAVAVGVASVLERDDYVVGHHRSHGHVIAKGGELRAMMAELLGRRTGSCKGLGGSMHIADLDLNILGCNGIVGASMPIACGAALAAEIRGTRAVAVVFFGDGAVNQGVSHEALNLAATWKLPVVFVCENNQFALSVDWRASRAVEDIAPRASGYGIPWQVVDGNDVLAVADAARASVDGARNGGGPAFIEATTYRRTQHSLRTNLPDVRDPALVRTWEARDPIPRFERFLVDRGVESDALASIGASAKAEVEEAIRLSLADPPASEDDMRAAVYAPPTAPPPVPPEPDSRPLSFMQAINEALMQEMESDDAVIVMGEDIAAVGGLFRATEGLLERFGSARVRDTPISEAGFVGAAIGAALAGLRPVVELQFFDFCAVAMDQITNQAAKLRFMMGGSPRIPLVIRGASGSGLRLGAQHSQSLEAWFCHTPGLVVVMPSNPYDAKGLLRAAIHDDNPVIFLEPKQLFFLAPEPVPTTPYSISLGKARIVRPGNDVTVVAIGGALPIAMRAAAQLANDDISLEVIDPRTLQPLDLESILASVSKTSRAVVVHEATRYCGFGAEVAAAISEHGFWDLDQPVQRVGADHTPIPYERQLEAIVTPGVDDVVAAVRVLT